MTDETQRTDDRIDTIAEAHDVDRATARSILADFQDPADFPQVCEACGRAHSAPADVYVARVPLEEGEEGVRCAECYTEYVDDETALSSRESEAVAYLLVSDLSHREISSETGMGTVSNYRTRAIEKYEEAQSTLQPGPIVPIMEALLYE